MYEYGNKREEKRKENRASQNATMSMCFFFKWYLLNALMDTKGKELKSTCANLYHNNRYFLSSWPIVDHGLVKCFISLVILCQYISEAFAIFTLLLPLRWWMAMRQVQMAALPVFHYFTFIAFLQ